MTILEIGISAIAVGTTTVRSPGIVSWRDTQEPVVDLDIRRPCLPASSITVMRNQLLRMGQVSNRDRMFGCQWRPKRRCVS